MSKNKENPDIEQPDDENQEDVLQDQEIEQDISNQEQEIEQLQQEIEEIQEQHKRLLAEYANFKRRTSKEKASLGQITKCATLESLLPALDTLDRAVSAPDGEEYRTGVENTARQLYDLLEKQGLEEIEALGQPFDPEIHNAVSREDADKEQDGEVVTEVYQKGYRIGDRVVRPAMVKVAN